MICQLSGETLYEVVQDVQHLEPAFRVEIGEVLQQVVDMLLNTSLFKGIVKHELGEDTWTDGARASCYGGYHQVLDDLQEIIEVCTNEFPIDKSS